MDSSQGSLMQLRNLGQLLSFVSIELNIIHSPNFFKNFIREFVDLGSGKF